MRLLSATVLAACFVSQAAANGRPPVTNAVFFRPGDNDTVFVRATFGLLVSRDGGCSFRWMCEQNIGYGGTFDPKYAVAADGTLFATTFEGLRVSRDGGCSFATATAELPPNDPNRIADIWVDALDLASNGHVWIATAESGRSNDVFRSTDNGVTFERRGMASATIWWKSVKVAPSHPMRVYVSGYEVASPAGDAMPMPKAHLFTSPDAGETWVPLPLTNVQLGSTPIVTVAAIDAADPQKFFLISVGTNGGMERLYRTIDGGTTFTEVLAVADSVTDVLIVDATTVIATTLATGAHKSIDGGQTFAPIAAPRLACIGKRPDGSLLGCGPNWDPDFMAVAAASADAAQWNKVFRFVELAGPLECPTGTAQHDTCAVELWPVLQQQFGSTGPKDPACALPEPQVDGAPPPPKSGGCCDANGRAPMTALLGIGLGVILLRRRQRRG